MSGPSINRAKLVDVACKLNLGDTLEKILQAIDREQASEAEAEKWANRWRELMHPNVGPPAIERWKQFLAELRSEPKLASDCTVEELAKKALTLMQDRCLQLYSDSMKYTGAIADAIRPHLRPASEGGRKVKARSAGSNSSWQWEVKGERGVRLIGPNIYSAGACREHLEAIMQAAGAEVEWENE